MTTWYLYLKFDNKKIVLISRRSDLCADPGKSGTGQQRKSRRRRRNPSERSGWNKKWPHKSGCSRTPPRRWRSSFVVWRRFNLVPIHGHRKQSDSILSFVRHSTDDVDGLWQFISGVQWTFQKPWSLPLQSGKHSERARLCCSSIPKSVSYVYNKPDFIPKPDNWDQLKRF